MNNKTATKILTRIPVVQVGFVENQNGLHVPLSEENLTKEDKLAMFEALFDTFNRLEKRWHINYIEEKKKIAKKTIRETIKEMEKERKKAKA